MTKFKRREGITCGMRWIVGLILFLPVVALAAPPLDVKVALGKNVSTLVGTDWPVDTDGNFIHGAEFEGPVRASAVLPGGKVVSANPANLLLSQDNDTVTTAAFVFPKRASNGRAAEDISAVLDRWKTPIQASVYNDEEFKGSAIWVGGVKIFVRVQAGRAWIILRIGKTR
jgi:hypothetical protein